MIIANIFFIKKNGALSDAAPTNTNHHREVLRLTNGLNTTTTAQTGAARIAYTPTKVVSNASGLGMLRRYLKITTPRMNNVIGPRSFTLASDISNTYTTIFSNIVKLINIHDSES